MKIALLIGHSILHSCVDTSLCGYVNEYQYVKELAPCICNELNNIGYDCDLICPPEYLLKNHMDELLYKIPLINTKRDDGEYKYDLVIELHLNYSSDPLKHGVTVFYKPGDCFGFRISERICEYYSKHGFFNLGVFTPNLHILHESVVSTIVVELYYCTSVIDVSLSKKYGLDKMAEIFVSAINGGKYKPSYKHTFIRNKHGWVNTPNGKEYYNQSIQYMDTIENINGRYYYFNKKGYLSTGWKEIRDNLYYFNPNDKGAMVVNDVIYIDKEKYCFDKNGILTTMINQEDMNKYSTDNSCDISINGNILIYPNNLQLRDIEKLIKKYPNYLIIKDLDYKNYSRSFTKEVYINNDKES